MEAFTQEADLSWVADLLTERRDEILTRWLDAAADQPFHRDRSERAVADHIPALFDALARLLTKYSGRSKNASVPLDDPDVHAAAQSHARVRFEQGFVAPDVTTEFRLLRQELGRAIRRYVSDRSPTGDVIAAELLLHDALDGAVFLALTALSEHEIARRHAEGALQESEERFRLLVEAVEDYAICTLTPEGSVSSWNDGAERMLGHKRATTVGKPVQVIFTETDAGGGLPARLLATAAADGRASATGELCRADGSRVHADVAVAALRDDAGTLVGFAIVVHDITERRRADEERATAAAERDAFFETLGHDLKSPLASAVAISQLLRRQLSRGPLDPAHLDSRLSSIEAALRRGALRVDELMDLAQRAESDAPAADAEVLDLVALVRGVLVGYRITNEQHEFVLDAPTGPVAGAWDSDQIERSIDNLVSNAVKFSPRGGLIAVSVSEEGTPTAREAVVTVSDEGLGIPPGDRDAIFNRFRRGSNVTNVPGSGLGLWSVRRIVERYKGTLEVDSRVGEGSTFTIRLPLTATAR